MYYILCFLISLIASLILTPLFRTLALKYHILDHPHSEVKTHHAPVPYLGGVSIFISFCITLFVIRLFTNFPTGTLYNLRSILIGGIIIFLLGLYDDLKPKGIGFKMKFLWQIILTIILISFDIRIKFISPEYIGIILTLIWVVGIINAFNIIDIMDGLASGIAIIASLAFFFISLPGEEVYVNFTSLALAGACLGFMPFNLSKKHKIFMGDTGSLFIGYLLAAISLGTTYTKLNEIGLFAPILILGIPIYDTLFVMYHRYRQGISPFLGSKDHFALRLEKKGYSRTKIIILVYFVSFLLSLCAFIITHVDFYTSLSIYLMILLISIYIGYELSKIKVDNGNKNHG